MRLIALAVLGVALLACSAPGAVTPSGVVPDQEMSIVVSNQTTIPVDIEVNDVAVAEVAAGDLVSFDAGQLPPLPWDVAALSPSGRALLSMVVRSGDVVMLPGGASGRAARVDLSCGRIDMYSGPPLDGPMPGPGRPGDCD